MLSLYHESLQFSSLLYLFPDAAKDFANAEGDLLAGGGLVGNADECDEEPLVLLLYERRQRLFVASVSFANLSLHAVSIDGAVELPLGNADKDGNGRGLVIGGLPFNGFLVVG
jgi:hypothetical protein